MDRDGSGEGGLKHECENDCQYLHVILVLSWKLVQGMPHLSPEGSLDRPTAKIVRG